MDDTSRQINENVVVLMHRLRITNSDIADALQMNRVSVGNRINGKTEWRAAELAALADMLSVSMNELAGTIPAYKEWNQRRQQPREALRPVAGEVRWLVAPEAHFDALPQPLNAWSPTSDIMSF